MLQLNLESQCFMCEGSGVVEPKQEMTFEVPTCPVCFGVGYHLTESGERLLAFLKRWRDI